jgi:hypothetical protein
MLKRLLLPTMGPLALLALASFYLLQLLKIRGTTGSTYSDQFAIPVTVILIALLLTDLLRTVVRHLSVDDRIAFGQLRSQIGLAACLCIYLVIFETVPFWLGATLFMIASHLVLIVLQEQSVIEVTPLIRWVAFALGISLALDYMFTSLLGVPLP